MRTQIDGVDNVGGLLTCAGLLLIFPQCLAGPYGQLGPELRHIWIDNITEAQSILVTLNTSPAQAIALTLGPLIALTITIFRAITTRNISWILIALYLTLALLIALMQVRGVRLAAIFSIPAAAWLIATARQKYLATNRLPHALGLLGSWLAFAGIAHFFALNFLFTSFATATQTIATESQLANQNLANKAACYLPENFKTLANLPAANIINPIDLGAHILLFTPHSIVAAPYHRNISGIQDTYDFLNSPPETARAIAENRDLTLFVTCASHTANNLIPDRADNAIGQMLVERTLPNWITRISPPDDAIEIYKIDVKD